MNNKRKDRDWLDSLKSMFKDGNYDKLYSELLLYLDKYPYDDYGNFLYASLLIRLNNYEEAKDVLSSLTNCKSKIRHQCCLMLADIYADEGKINKVKELLEEYSDIPFSDMRQDITLANIYLKINHIKKAIKIINSINVNEACNYGDKILYAELLSNIGKTKESDKVLDTVPLHNNSYNMFKMADIREKNESYGKALNIIKFLNSNIDSSDKNYNKCKMKEIELLIKKNQNDEAIDKCYNMILSNIDNNTQDLIYLILGDAYKNKYSYLEAKENYEIVLKSDNSDRQYEALYRLGILNEIAGYSDEAFIYFDRLKTNKKYRKSSYYEMISLNIKEEDYDKANYLFNEIINLDGESFGYMERRLTDVFLNKMLGVEKEILSDSSYVERQIINFDEEMSKKHIIDHHVLSKEFNKNIDFEELYEFTKNNLVSDNICYGDIFDVYEIDYANIGENKNKYRVIVLPHTKNIITMYPIPDNANKYLKLAIFQKREKELAEKKEEKMKKLYSKFYRK